MYAARHLAPLWARTVLAIERRQRRSHCVYRALIAVSAEPRCRATWFDTDLCLAGLTLVHRSAQGFQKLSAVEGLLEDGGNFRSRIW